MSNLLQVTLILSLLSAFAQAQIVGQIEDPQDSAISPCADITSAWVEKEGTSLKFVMTLRGPVPSSLPDPCTIGYYWLIDADNDIQTGDHPSFAGSDLNLRVTVNNSITGSFDYGQAMDTSGPVTVTVSANRVEAVISMSQLHNPDIINFRCRTWEQKASTGSGNDITPQTAKCWLSRYAVIYEQPYYGLDANCIVLKCTPENPFDRDSAIVAFQQPFSDSGLSPISHPIQAVGTDNEYAVNSFSNSIFGHLRNFTSLGINNSTYGTSGLCHTFTWSGNQFKLASQSGQTGPVPHGLFTLHIRHEYLIQGMPQEKPAWAGSNASVILTDMGDPFNPVQKHAWTHGRGCSSNRFSFMKDDELDLADYGFEFDRNYILDVQLYDDVGLDDAVDNCTSIADASLTTSIKVNFAGDLDADRKVNFKDLALLASNWLLGQ